MPLAMRSLIACGLLLLLTVAHAANPLVSDFTVQVKSGDTLGIEFDLAEYQVDFNEEVRWAEMIPCAKEPSCNITPPSGCPPCDYSGQGAACGTFPPGTPSSCDPAVLCNYQYYCNNTAATWWTPWTTITPGTPIAPQTEYPQGTWNYFRVYFPQDHSCDYALRLLAPSASGDVDMYFSRDPAIQGDFYPWGSITAVTILSYICPSSRLNSDYGTTFGAGTWFISFVAGSSYAKFSFGAQWESLASAILAAPNPGSLPVPTICTNMASTHTCIMPDQEYELTGNKPASGELYFVSQLPAGTCSNATDPLLWGIHVTTDRQYARLAFSWWDSQPTPHPDAFLPNSPGRGDYVPIYLAASRCDSISGSPYDHVYFTVTLPNDAAGTAYKIRIFTSVDPIKFRARQLNDLVMQKDTGYVLRFGMDLECENSTGGLVTLGACYAPLLQNDCELGYTVSAPLTQEVPPNWPYLPVINAVYGNGALPAPNFNLQMPYALSSITFTLAYRYSYYVPSNPNQRITRDLRVLKNIDPLKCKPNFRHTNLLVNSQFQAVQVPANYARYWEPACNRTAYDLLAASYIDAHIPQLSDTSLSPIEISKIAAELDAISLSDAYYSCYREVRDLLSSMQNSVTMSTYECLNDDPSNSCCQLGYSSQAFDWDTCCTQHNASDLRNTYAAPNSLNGICADADCVNTYVRDYSFATTADCRALRTDSNRFSYTNTYFWGTCSESIYGRGLTGRGCSVDADCVSGTACNGKVCVGAASVMLNAFLDCLLDSQSLPMFLLLSTKNITSTDHSTIKNALISLYTISDCTSTTGLAIPADDTDTGQQHYRWEQPGCTNALCSPFFKAFGPFGTLPAECAGYYHGWNCPTPLTFAWVLSPATDASGCSNSVCNWNFAAAGQPTCTAIASVCAHCYGSSNTECVGFPSIPDSTTCAQYEACLLANGTHIAVPKGTCASQPSTCDQDCVSAGDVPVPCTGSTDCGTAGYCSDTEVLALALNQPATGVCILPAGPQFFPACFQLYPSFPIASSAAGCIATNVTSPAECRAIAIDSKYDTAIWPWWHARASSQTECTANCGCAKPTADPTQYAAYIVGPPSTPAACALCGGGQQCVSYWTWTPARFTTGQARSLSWVATTTTSTWSVTSSGFDFAALAQAVSDATTELHNFQTQTYEMCRFNLASPAISAVSCACNAANSSESAAEACVDAVDSSTPSGQGTVCAGATLSLGAPPHILNFNTNSLATGCKIVTIIPVSRIAFAAAVEPQKLSSYFTPKLRHASGAFRFVNPHGAVIGQVAGDGIRVTTSTTFTNVSICLDRGIAVPTDLQSRFNTWDIAYSFGSTNLIPLYVPTTYDTTNGWCATVDIRPGIYVPVIRLPGTQAQVSSKKQEKVTTGERAVLGIICGIYFLFALFTPYYCIMVALNLRAECLKTATFWLPIFFMVANILRGIYFARIAAADLSETTASDIILVELPTMLRFTAATLMGLFWVAVLVSVGTISKAVIARNFWVMLGVLNGIMYCLFIVAVVVFSRLKETVSEQCSGRLPNHIDSTGKKTAYIVYQAVIAAMGALVAVLYLLGGIGLAFKMRSFQKDTSLSHGTTRVQFRLFLVGSLVSATFLAFSVFLLIVALTEPHIPYLAIILIVLELVPEAILYWNLPSPKASAIVTGSTATGSGTGTGTGTASGSASGTNSNSRY